MSKSAKVVLVLTPSHELDESELPIPRCMLVPLMIVERREDQVGLLTELGVLELIITINAE